MKAPLSKLFCDSKHVFPTSCKSIYDTLSIHKGQEDKVGHNNRVSLVPPSPHCWVILIIRARAQLISTKVAWEATCWILKNSLQWLDRLFKYLTAASLYRREPSANIFYFLKANLIRWSSLARTWMWLPSQWTKWKTIELWNQTRSLF